MNSRNLGLETFLTKEKNITMQGFILEIIDFDNVVDNYYVFFSKRILKLDWRRYFPLGRYSFGYYRSWWTWDYRDCCYSFANASSLCCVPDDNWIQQTVSLRSWIRWDDLVLGTIWVTKLKCLMLSLFLLKNHQLLKFFILVQYITELLLCNHDREWIIWT